MTAYHVILKWLPGMNGMTGMTGTYNSLSGCMLDDLTYSQVK
jgi:hypothetical protein